jgi:hypothetical protein
VAAESQISTGTSDILSGAADSIDWTAMLCEMVKVLLANRNEIRTDIPALLARVAALETERANICLSVTHEGPDVTKRVMDRVIAARAALGGET